MRIMLPSFWYQSLADHDFSFERACLDIQARVGSFRSVSSHSVAGRLIRGRVGSHRGV